MSAIYVLKPAEMKHVFWVSYALAAAQLKIAEKCKPETMISGIADHIWVFRLIYFTCPLLLDYLILRTQWSLKSLVMITCGKKSNQY